MPATAPTSTSRTTSNRPRTSGLNRWPSRHWAINVAWTQIVALAANLLACFRHLALPRRRAARRRPETAALPAAAPTRPADPRATQTVAAPARGLALDHRRDQRLAGGQGTARTDLTTTPTDPDDHERTPAGAWNPAPPTRQSDHDPYPRTGNHDQNDEMVIKGTTPSPR